ncbi:MAG TPA: lactate utilization protein [Bryobacteraceae bacterium]|nr:lactate utilization protein [Bryobacteraceae bacterium]
MSARDEILSRVRSALGRQASDPVPDPPPPALAFITSSPAERVETFRLALEALAGKVSVARTPAEAGDYVRAAVAGRTFAASHAPLLAQCGIAASSFSREDYAKVDVGITSADYALAETGSLVVLTESSESRLLSLLPPCHIAVVARSRIVENLEQLLTLLPEPTANSSAMVIITGPSRTADIEMLLVRGVHGPGEIHVVILED